MKGKEILYIGKATSLADRVKSYMSKDLIKTRGPLILDMVTQSESISFKKTESVLEALILESNLIKKHQPKYNTKEKDNKSFNYVCITKEIIPRVLIIRERNLKKIKTSIGYDYFYGQIKISDVFGPFTNGPLLKESMKIIRKILPYVDNDSLKKQNKEFYKQLNLTPNLEKGQLTLADNKLPGLLGYKNNVKNIILFLKGKKNSVINNLKKEMTILAKDKEFEKANEVKKRIFALNHINDIALIKEDINLDNHPPFRIEAYDIAHMSGKNMVGVMVVIENNNLVNSEYRKFNIKTVNGANDTAALAEILERRLQHKEWRLPDLIVIDGGVGQINIAKKIIKNNKLPIPVVSVVKDEKHKAKAILGDEKLIMQFKKLILLANAESHRFAITFHKLKRKKGFIS